MSIIINNSMNSFNFTKENLLISKELTHSLLDRFDTIFNEGIYKNDTSNMQELTKDTISKEPLFASVLSQIQKKFQSIANVTDLKFEKLWLVNSKSNDTNKAIVPYIPHIDKTRFLKAMIYLNDVSMDHGPIHLGKAKNNIDIEQKRKRLPSDYKARNLNVISNESLETNLTPMLGEAGDVIFFDTNTPHKAGIISEGYYRKILRFDFERPFFNSKKNMVKSFFNKIIKF
jgi:hypothetical protein